MPVMNFFDNSKLLLEGGVYYVDIKGARFQLSDFQQKALKQNGQTSCDIIAGIRPSHISVGQGDLTAKVVVNEMMGSEVHLHADCQGNEVVMVIPTVNLSTDVSMGQTIHFSTTPELIQLFDKKTQNNLIWYDKASADGCQPVCKSYNF